MGQTSEERWTKKKKVHIKYDKKCAYCGCDIELEYFHVDHIVSKNYYQNHREEFSSDFDINSLSNLNPACASCNCMKYIYGLEDFRYVLRKGIRKELKENAKLRFAVEIGMVEMKDDPIIFYFEKINQL